MNSEILIRKTAISTIAVEIETLQSLINCISEDFVTVVQAVFAAQGRLVVTGIGKSALVAKKIVATLNSTGTPSIFMHASDAIHGDLGMIRPADMVLCLSKSGNTAEIKMLVALLRNADIPVIGMVSQLDSFLGRQAQYVLHTPVSKEAEPNNLAPTASTTAQMAMGDALAAALLALRGFSPKDFAQFHPGGSLGKQLYLRVRDIYPHNEKPKVLPKATIRTTIMEMTSNRLGATAVVDGSGQILGIITDGDIRRMLEREEDTSGLCAADIMSLKPKTIEPDTLAVEALELMRKNSITQLLVAREEDYLGVIHLHDILKEGVI